MIPILYNADETVFEHNGIGVLKDALKVTVFEERNGTFDMEMEYPVTGMWFKELKDFRLVMAKPNDTDNPHLFRIYEIVKSLNDQTVTVYATSKTNDLGSNLVNFAEVKNVNAQGALDAIKANLVYPTTYDLISDIQTLSSSSWNNTSPLACVAGVTGSVIQNWGGEIRRTNHSIIVHGRRGTDRVATLRVGRGLSGFTQTVSTKGLITCVLPYVTFTREGEEHTVKGTIVQSPLVNNYPVRYVEAVDYSSEYDIFPQDPEAAEGEPTPPPIPLAAYKAQVLTNLNAEALKYFTYRNPNCDKPKLTIEADLIELTDSSEYKYFRKLEHISLTDTVVVWVEKFDVDVEVQVTKIQYDSLREQVISFTAGTQRYSLYEDVKKEYDHNVDALKEYIRIVENGIYNTIRITADGKNNIFSGYTTPDESLLKVDDIWYKPLANGEIEMYRWNGSDWEVAVQNADKLTIGSIDARKVNLIYLNASNISTGTIVGANGAWNLNTGEFRLGAVGSASSLHWNGTSLSIKMSNNQSLEDYMASIVESMDVQYATSPSKTIPPTGTWTTTAPAWNPTTYIWSRTKVFYKNGTVDYKPTVNGVCISGTHGMDGRGISDIKEQYYLSTSGTSQTGGSWSYTAPVYDPKKFMWTRSMISWTNPTESLPTTPLLSSEWNGIKGAYTAISDVSSSVTDWTFKFGSIGGRNLLSSTHLKYSNNTYPTARWDMTERMVANVDYTITVWGSLGAGKTHFAAYINGGSLSLVNLAPVPGQPGAFRGTFKGKAGGVSDPDVPDFINVYPMPNTVTTISKINAVQLEFGVLGTAWTPSPFEMYVGATRIDQFGLDVSNNVDQTHTSVAVDGLRVLDVKTGGPILTATDDGVISPQVRARSIFGDNIVNSTSGNRTLYVSSTATGDGSGRNSSNKGDSINTVLEEGIGEGVKFLNNRCVVTIKLSGTINEDVYVGGFMGSGTLVIDGENVGVLKGNVYVENTTVEVTFRRLKHYKVDTATIGSGAPYLLPSLYMAENSTNVYIKECTIIGNGTGQCFVAWRNGGIHSQQNDIVDFERTYVAWTNSIVSNDRDIGSRAGTSTLAYSGYGGRVALAVTRPLTGTGGTISSAASGGSNDTTDSTGVGSNFAPSTPQTPITTTTEYTKTFYFTRKRENVTENNWFTDNKFGQGTSTANVTYRGHGYLYNSVKNWLEGSGGYTSGSVSMRLRAKRGSLWGTDSSPNALKFVAPYAITTGAVIRGAITPWVTLSAGARDAIISGNDHFNTTTTAKADYSEWDWVQLEVTAKKR